MTQPHGIQIPIKHFCFERVGLKSVYLRLGPGLSHANNGIAGVRSAVHNHRCVISIEGGTKSLDPPDFMVFQQAMLVHEMKHISIR